MNAVMDFFDDHPAACTAAFVAQITTTVGVILSVQSVLEFRGLSARRSREHPSRVRNLGVFYHARRCWVLALELVEAVLDDGSGYGGKGNPSFVSSWPV
jgi:hypothetical protein